jgi:polar amino acid transport system substrate-binding protein
MNVKILVFSLFVLSVDFAHAQEISVVTEEWPPYNFKRNGEIVGLGTDIVKATLDKADIKYTIRMYPWARAYKKALNEKGTLIYTMVRNDEREWRFKWVGPFASRQVALFKLAERTNIVVSSLDDARKYNIGLVRDDATHEFFRKHEFKKINLATDETQNVKMLFKGRIELITGNEVALGYRMKQLGYRFSQVEKVFTFVDKGGYYMGISNGTPGNITIRITEAFDQIKRDGTLEKIRNKYLQ